MYRTRKSKKIYNPQKVKKTIQNGAEPCPFCGNIPKANIVQQSQQYLIIKNIYGYQYWEAMDVIDHLIIIPKRHVETISQLSVAEKTALINLIAKYEKKGYNVYAREPDNTIKSIPHQHTHLIKTNNKRATLFIHTKKPYLVIKK